MREERINMKVGKKIGQDIGISLKARSGGISMKVERKIEERRGTEVVLTTETQTNVGTDGTEVDLETGERGERRKKEAREKDRTKNKETKTGTGEKHTIMSVHEIGTEAVLDLNELGMIVRRVDPRNPKRTDMHGPIHQTAITTRGLNAANRVGTLIVPQTDAEAAVVAGLVMKIILKGVVRSRVTNTDPNQV